MLLCQYLGWFIEKINLILIVPLIKVIFAFLIFSFIAASILFPTAKFDDFFMHAKIILQQNQEEKSVPHDLEKAQKMIKQREQFSREHNADLHLNFIKNTLPFDINIIPFVHNKSNQDKLVIFKIILGVFSFVCVLGVFIMIDFLLARHFLTSKRIILLLGGIMGIFAYKFLQLYYQDDILKKYYVSPAKLSEKIHINQSKNKKNLLFIYVESLDTAFENPELFGENLLKPLKDLGGYQLPMISNVGTTNSLTGVYASLCGLALYGGYQENVAKDELVQEKICLGHILNSFNYQQMSIQGTSETNIYTQSFKKIFNNNKITFNGCHELIAKGYKPSKTSFDGCLHNQDILQETEQQLIAFKNQIKENKANAPFHLSNFLIDTHGPQGLFSKNCTQSEQQDDIQVRGSIKCAIRNLTNKLKLWQNNHYLDNTIIVIMGDHLFMPGLSNAYLFPEERKVYFQILGLDMHKLTPKRKKLNHFDIMPTILDALGLLPNNQSYLGLGSSVFRDDPQFEKRQKKLYDTYYFFSDI